MSRDKDKGHLLVALSSLALLKGKLEDQACSHTKALQDFASSDFQFGGLVPVFLPAWGHQQALNMAQGPPANPERSVVLIYTL